MKEYKINEQEVNTIYGILNQLEVQKGLHNNRLMLQIDNILTFVLSHEIIEPTVEPTKESEK